jgi:hypothetical protein
MLRIKEQETRLILHEHDDDDVDDDFMFSELNTYRRVLPPHAYNISRQFLKFETVLTYSNSNIK